MTKTYCDCPLHRFYVYHVCREEVSFNVDGVDTVALACVAMESDDGHLGSHEMTKVVIVEDDGSEREATDAELAACASKVDDCVEEWFESKARNAADLAAEDAYEARAENEAYRAMVRMDRMY